MDSTLSEPRRSARPDLYKLGLINRDGNASYYLTSTREVLVSKSSIVPNDDDDDDVVGRYTQR